MCVCFCASGCRSTVENRQNEKWSFNEANIQFLNSYFEWIEKEGKIPIDIHTHTRINIYRDFDDDNVSHYHFLTYVRKQHAHRSFLGICRFEQQYLFFSQNRLKEHKSNRIRNENMLSRMKGVYMWRLLEDEKEKR